MFKNFKKYLLRFIGSLMFITLIGSIAYGLRTAILEHDPIVISMKTKFAQEQNIKVYYTKKTQEIYNDADFQEFHVNVGEGETNFELQNLNNVSYIKFVFDRNVGAAVFSDIKVIGSNTFELTNLNNLIPENIDNFEIRDNSFIVASGSLNPTLRYKDPINVYSYSYVWGIPINVYTLSGMLIIIFVCFWWLLSVIALINKDIADSFIKETKF